MSTWVSHSSTLPLLDATRASELLVIAPVKKAVVFDFDGTIADSFPINLEIGNRLAVEYGMEPVTPEKLERWQHLGAKEILAELDISVFRLPGMLRRFKSEINREVERLPMIPGMRAAIEELWDRGYILGVITSNSAENVRKFLAHQGLEHLFEFVESCPRLLGKEHMLRQAAQRHGLTLDKMLYVGDETRDIEAANKIKVKSVAVTWGFNSQQALNAKHPSYLIDRPQQLVEIAKDL
jgi:phosphoglycolate phosphatase-like HAD superfamily hydrolase